MNKGCTHRGWLTAIKSNEVNDSKGMIGNLDFFFFFFFGEKERGGGGNANTK
jgi:hypothetical protein